MKLVPTATGVIIQFVDDTTSTRFVNSTQSGILITEQNQEQANLPRWGKVTHVGAEAEGVEPGNYVLVEPGMWTRGFFVGGQRFWKTNYEKLMAVSDEPIKAF